MISFIKIEHNTYGNMFPVVNGPIIINMEMLKKTVNPNVVYLLVIIK